MNKDEKNLRSGLDELALLNMWRLFKMIHEESGTMHEIYMFPDTTGAVKKLTETGWKKVFFFNNFSEAMDKMSAYLDSIARLQ
ncbi:MAG: hypothetical protein ACYSW3_27065 [Planctomycetota bacterium]|jgi:hypothetical protein